MHMCMYRVEGDLKLRILSVRTLWMTPMRLCLDHCLKTHAFKKGLLRLLSSKVEVRKFLPNLKQIT